ncbi:hypothetical protein [Halpernia frigidisoli]|uniref:Uncharacterized protein n=1 Tax=Halpernia frigidisoli TaxID=1125876 RepID=A0A1I3FUK1_9FLAO|nr:hypothetical protein [Halpernia frigidisoli]SFI14923.1 hypothetical protein SAMN05443292_1640 [Halpernia frigidisoli]
MIDAVPNMTEENISSVKMSQINIDNEVFFKISNVDEMRPFFMSIVSDSNHWMFISSNGALSAGRKNSELALFPYYTDDKITESAEITGSKTIIKVSKNDEVLIWEPFSIRNHFKNIKRNLYKSFYGNSVIFEEINEDLGLVFKYKWSNSNVYGFVRETELKNISDFDINVSICDGLQNILPAGVGSDLQNSTSNLVDAYKRSELDSASKIGIFALSATIVDKAEPNESLTANIAYSLGFKNSKILLSSTQLQNFRDKKDVSQETDSKGEKGAYFIISDFNLSADETKEWTIVANVNQNISNIVSLSSEISDKENLIKNINSDIKLGTKNLLKLINSADGIQHTADLRDDTRYYSNTLFNIMRGGIFDDQYNIEKQDFLVSIKKRNSKIFTHYFEELNQLPEVFTKFELSELVEKLGNEDLKRLSVEYLPLKFSRRHGDPSRPWNKFSIETRSEKDGSKILNYEGNWRDIFQNWEALAHAFPAWQNSMLFRFLNASTFEGYNPYRIIKNGFDWETIEPDDPWSYIGYWGDHQIIYLLKFLEFSENYYPKYLEDLFLQKSFVYANVPYRIKNYQEILKNPKSTIDFVQKDELEIHKNKALLGEDATLKFNQKNEIHHVTFLEKILATTLSKLSNFIPEGGIWMNTQRPEWNDANNALVGNGVSMVTLNYLSRFLNFFKTILEKSEEKSVEISVELEVFFQSLLEIFTENQSLLQSKITDESRKKMMDLLGNAGSNYREQIYNNDFSGNFKSIKSSEILKLMTVSLAFLDKTIDANKKENGLYHAYNLVSYIENSATISHLSDMLEGQVAVLSSGHLSGNESLEVLDALRKSDLYRQDQNSYLLYPNNQIKGFLTKNVIPESEVFSSDILKNHIESGNKTLIEKDVKNHYHFNSNFKNADDLKQELEVLNIDKNEIIKILNIYENVFNHKEFTGRSGTFFGYEGLGSIYWHMVSKLLLALQEVTIKARKEGNSAEILNQLIDHYEDIKDGIGAHKSPKNYGSFPTDPYSHTPFHRGAQQPGMTGQVKEDLLARWGELGIVVEGGCVKFDPFLLRKSNFIETESEIKITDVNNGAINLKLPAKSMGFTLCQVPVVYLISNEKFIKIKYSDREEQISSNTLNEKLSAKIWERTGEIKAITVGILEEQLR